MGLKNVSIKSEYRSLIDDVVRDFYIPLLKESILYQRAVGFFSSSALIATSSGIDGLVRNGGKIQVVASPRLTQEDIEEIQKGYEVRKTIENALIREIIEPELESEKVKLSYIAKLISDGVLDIKIAYISSNNGMAMYHEKVGILTDENNDVIAFSGSMNETDNAFRGNYESFDVFCSWNNDSERVLQKQSAFKAIWEDYEPGIETMDFPDAAKRKLYEYNPSLRGNNGKESYKKELGVAPKEDIYLPENFKIRSYQLEALANWQKNKFCGIYDMATGTGKTLTALASIEQLYRYNNRRLAVIILCPYQHLVEQWVEDILDFGMRPIIGYSSSKQKKWKELLEQAVRSFNLKVSNHFCFITTNASFVTKKVQEQIRLLSDDVVFVVDEAHNIGASNYRRFLPNDIHFRLGLSATIDRHNDEEGSETLLRFFGEKCIEYSLKDAINNGMLTRYYYYPVLTWLDEEELEKYIAITTQIAKTITKKRGKVVLTEYAKQLLIKRSRIIAGARSKLIALEQTMRAHVNDKHLLIYCGATTVKENDADDFDFGTRQIDLVTDLLGNKMNMRVGRFTSQESAKERVQIRKAFADGESLQALVAIKCLDEGVNIPSIKTAFVLASSTNPKEYIQRRGRVLRKFPGKNYAVIYDFITLPFDFEQMALQSEEVIQTTKGLIKRELIRMMDFAQISENPSKTYNLIYDLKHAFNISEQDLTNEEGNSDVI